MLWIFFNLESGNSSDKVPQHANIGSTLARYNASAALGVEPFLIFLITFTQLAASLQVLSECEA